MILLSLSSHNPGHFFPSSPFPPKCSFSQWFMFCICLWTHFMPFSLLFVLLFTSSFSWPMLCRFLFLLMLVLTFLSFTLPLLHLYFLLAGGVHKEELESTRSPAEQGISKYFPPSNISPSWAEGTRSKLSVACTFMTHFRGVLSA